VSLKLDENKLPMIHSCGPHVYMLRELILTGPLEPCHAPLLLWWLFSRVLDPGDLHSSWRDWRRSPRHLAGDGHPHLSHRWQDHLAATGLTGAVLPGPLICLRGVKYPNVWASGQELSLGLSHLSQNSQRLAETFQQLPPSHAGAVPSSHQEPYAF
jgi:hypothetical protein